MKSLDRIIIIALALVSFSSRSYAQQDLLVSQQLFSRINVNPAGTGNNDKIDAFLLGRFQWVGVDNSPRTGLFNVTGYCEKLKSGFGVTVNYDKMGIGHSSTNAQAVYSYHVDLNDKFILAMGLSAGAQIGYFNPSDNILRDESEMGNMETYTDEKETKVSPDVNFGLELTTMRWMLGVSCTHMLNDSTTTYKAGRHFYGYVRGFFPLNEKFDVAPALAYMHKKKIDVLEANVMGFYNRTVWGGITWKPDLSDPFDMSMLAATLGFEWKILRVGYTYDMNLGKCNHLPSNTHEVLLSVQL